MVKGINGGYEWARGSIYVLSSSNGRSLLLFYPSVTLYQQ